ncbi:IclR family transcriptional regulator C-terminal domain-containing protein [Streptomyces sp. NPDC057137]|uniref:IclR family transcriptional regulator domain-containing protein n=1 Tax=Streptomyces sp. NPDC057137 TaxID=3346030 RepID=UPI00362B741B
MTDPAAVPLASAAVPLAPAASAAPREAVGPLIRGLSVLRALAGAGGRLSVGDLVRATALARSTVDRTLSTLERLGHVRLEGKAAVLAPRSAELGNAYLSACRLPDLCGPAADRLADELDESVSLAVPDRDGIRFVHQSTRRRTMSLAFRIGDRLPAECGAVGALLAVDWTEAEWDAWEARRRRDPLYDGFPAVPAEAARAGESFRQRVDAARQLGWAEDDQLIEPGLVALAMPVRDRAGRPVGVVSVVSHTSRRALASMREALLPRLRETVAEMEAEMGTEMEAEVEAEMGTERAPVARPLPPASAAPADSERARESKREMGPGFVESLARGLAVLASFGPALGEALGGDRTTGVPLSALAQATGLARATVRRALITLEHLGYVTSDDGLFRPLPRVLDLGFAPLSGLTLPLLAQPHLVTLVKRVQESASMSVLAGDDIQYVARVATERIMSVDITVGTRFPAYATSMGRVLLADLLAGLPPDERDERLRAPAPAALTPYTVTSVQRLSALLDQAGRDGYALVEGELEEGLRSLAVPVRDRDGRVVAAVNVSMPVGRRTAEESLADLLPPLRETAAGIEGDLWVAGRHTHIRTV